MSLKIFSLILISAICLSAFISASNLPRAASYPDFQVSRLSPESKSAIERKDFERKAAAFGPWMDDKEFKTFKIINSRRESKSISASSSPSSLIGDESKELRANNILNPNYFKRGHSSTARYSPIARIAFSNSMKDLTELDLINASPRTPSEISIENDENSEKCFTFDHDV